jgi:hypothetical protein
VHQREVPGERLQVQGPVERGIAAADDHQVVAAELLHAPHGIEDAGALVILDARYRGALGLERAAARRHHDDLAGDRRAGIGAHAEAAIHALQFGDHFAEVELRTERADLLHQLVDELLPRDDRPAGNVVDGLFRIEFGALAARTVENVDQVALEVEEAQFEDGKQPAGPAPIITTSVSRKPDGAATPESTVLSGRFMPGAPAR